MCLPEMKLARKGHLSAAESTGTLICGTRLIQKAVGVGETSREKKPPVLDWDKRLISFHQPGKEN